MGQQQLLLIILGVIIVGIAIAVGLSLFSAQSIQSNRDALINDLNNLAAQAYQYKIRPTSMGGGQGSYADFKIPSRMQSNENGSYVIESKDVDYVNVKAMAAQNGESNYITVQINATGKLTMWSYAGDFQ